MLKLIEDAYTDGQKSIIRSSASGTKELQNAVLRIGVEIGKTLVKEYFLKNTEIRTPMDATLSKFLPWIPLCAIITTRDDFNFLGQGISSILDNSISGYMDFKGQRGLQALTADITHMDLPNAKGQHVDTLVIAKAVLATGCTAIHLTKTSLGRYLPRKLIIASVFYSSQGVADLSHELPNADIILVGDEDHVNESGMLVPGVGNLDLRLSGEAHA